MSSPVLQYRIGLATNGLVDGPASGPTLTTAACLDLLLEWHAAWRALHPRHRASVALTGHCHAYKLAGGLFAKALEESAAAHQLVASWLPASMADKTRLVVDDLSVQIKDFALDPVQDLIVLLEHRPPVSSIARPCCVKQVKCEHVGGQNRAGEVRQRSSGELVNKKKKGTMQGTHWDWTQNRAARRQGTQNHMVCAVRDNRQICGCAGKMRRGVGQRNIKGWAVKKKERSE